MQLLFLLFKFKTESFVNLVESCLHQLENPELFQFRNLKKEKIIMTDLKTSNISVSDVMDILVILANEENLRVAVRESFKAGLLTGAATIVGGLLAGPRGLAIGQYTFSGDSD